MRKDPAGAGTLNICMYDYQKMTTDQRREAVEYRRLQRRPWHAPPHWEFTRECQFIISGACYEHNHVVGVSPERMSDCESDLLQMCGQLASVIYAWCILPNHYHVLLKTDALPKLREEIGKFHGRSSFKWNKEDGCRRRQVWYRCFDRNVKSGRHFWAIMNYIHHNPVHHGYVQRWHDWVWSSASEYLERVGTETAAKIWKKYPVLYLGAKWDVD